MYKAKVIGRDNKRYGFISDLGILLGLVAPGCAACGVGLTAVLGLSGAFLAFLPLGGLELSILAIIILIIAIFKTSNNSCKIMLKKNERRLKYGRGKGR